MASSSSSSSSLLLSPILKKEDSNQWKRKKKSRHQKKTLSFSPKKQNTIHLVDYYDRKSPELDVYDCDECSGKIVYGNRYHCKEFDCDYDLCHECFIIVANNNDNDNDNDNDEGVERKSTKNNISSSSSSSSSSKNPATNHQHSNWEIIPPDKDDDIDSDNND